MASYLPRIERPRGLLVKIVYFLMRRRLGKVPTPIAVFSARIEALVEERGPNLRPVRIAVPAMEDEAQPVDVSVIGSASSGVTATGASPGASNRTEPVFWTAPAGPHDHHRNALPR